MHALIASPFLDEHLIVRPGHDTGVQIPHARYAEVKRAADDGRLPPAWLVDAARQAFSLDIAGQPLAGTVLVRIASPYGYARASCEINKGCDYDCPHCYLGLKRLEAVPWPDKVRLLDIMRDAGVLWLQITGGEPLIDREFPEAYAYAFDLMLTISTNGSQLHKPKILKTLAERPPHHLSLSVYGATPDTYDAFTRNQGAFGRLVRGLDAAREAGLRLQLNIVLTKENADEFDAMERLAERYGHVFVFTNMSPTIDGGSAG
ncbi:radical SAM protein [Streptomyces sp. NPDC000983]|uniref:radical SAM protein n=1 Tax=Streptomyces sp. NPDC000983 TaxID=3154373 RepID=UPI00331713F9